MAPRHVAYSSPWKAEKSAQAMIIHDILQRPEFAGTHEALVINGNGVKGIKDGADMALQLVCETRDPAVSVVGPLPAGPACLAGWRCGDLRPHRRRQGGRRFPRLYHAPGRHAGVEGQRPGPLLICAD